MPDYGVQLQRYAFRDVILEDAPSGIREWGENDGNKFLKHGANTDCNNILRDRREVLRHQRRASQKFDPFLGSRTEVEQKQTGNAPDFIHGTS
jgi:hypothetical protein